MFNVAATRGLVPMLSFKQGDSPSWAAKGRGRKLKSLERVAEQLSAAVSPGHLSLSGPRSLGSLVWEEAEMLRSDAKMDRTPTGAQRNPARRTRRGLLLGNGLFPPSLGFLCISVLLSPSLLKFT